MTSRKRLLLLLAVLAPASRAAGQSCPTVSGDNTFAGATMQTECDGTVTSGCTAKSGVVWDAGASAVRLPGSAGNFQPPPGAAVSENVYYGAAADFDRDGWEDFIAADNRDRIYLMRNQTITCGTTGCSGSPTTAPTVQTIPDAWWDTLGNVRTAAFRRPTSSSGIKPSFDTVANKEAPMTAGDFNGDGWPDAVVIHAAHDTGTNNIRWPNAARLYLNTQNCRDASDQPCGAGSLCTGQPAHGACTGSGVAASGTPFLDTQLSCTTTTSCTRFFPTFATYDLRTGAAVSALGNGTTTPTTHKPGDFGPIGHSATNMATIDWDGDGDLDLLVGHSGGTCPGSLCTTAGRVFYPGIDVWKNDCAQSGSWNPATRACPGHIPRFSRSTEGTCNATSCDSPDTLIPSTAHNTTTLAPSANLNWDRAHKQNPGFAYTDIDQDGDYDLVMGSPGCCGTSSNSQYKLRIFKNTSNSPTVHLLDTANPISLSTSNGTYPGYEGSLTGVFVFDFSRDGWPDIITGSDGASYNASLGGRTRYWRNTGNSSTPFGTNWPSCSATPATCAGCGASCNPNPTTKMSESCGSTNCADLTAVPPEFGDFDIGFMLDYDRDPDGTKDLVLTNGNNTGEFYLFPNRATPASYSACGTVASGTLPTPAAEHTVSGACIAPTASVPPGTSVSYYLNNESPENYQLACVQTSAGFDPPLVDGQCCVTFPSITGRKISWKAVIDSNTTDGPGVCTASGTTTPRITSVLANYTYTTALQHYRAGVVVSDGVSYVGSFTQPGNRGHMYALAAGDGTEYFDVADKLDAQATRNVYTTEEVGYPLTKIAFSPTSPSSALIARVGAATAAEATSVISWALGKRFGLAGYSPSRLGAVISSTPAVLSPPFRPTWYSHLTAVEKSLYDTFATSLADRLPLALFAAMDGAIHAIITQSTNITHARNGEEAWAFVPPYVAAGMTSDYTQTQATGKLTVTSYPDGAPTLFDYKRSDGTVRTVAIVSDGLGGSSITALDVTDTVDASFDTTGPTPMWSNVPGDASAGKATSKVGIARTQIHGVETYVVVAGTGIHSTDTTKGRIVAGYNLETGALLWRFEMACALTSDVSVFETDDIGGFEPADVIDGFADRAVFADTCGYVYKVDPGQDLGGGWMDNAGMGSISLGLSNGVMRTALFSTENVGALGPGEQRPIAGTIGARTDSTTDMVLYFGTGGLESFDTTKVNEFYAIYAKDGTIRNKLTGSCSGGRCEKFYGGVVITPDAVILQRSVDALVGGACDFGTSSVESYNASSFAQLFDIDQIGGTPIHASTGPLYGDAGALYFATVSGEIKRIGAPRATVAGQDTASGAQRRMGAPENTDSNAPFTLVGWRVVL